MYLPGQLAPKKGVWKFFIFPSLKNSVEKEKLLIETLRIRRNKISNMGLIIFSPWVQIYFIASLSGG
jgi:hypothetical protein